VREHVTENVERALAHLAPRSRPYPDLIDMETKNTHNTPTNERTATSGSTSESWRDLCYAFIVSKGGQVTKKELDAHFLDHEKVQGRKFWKEQISRTVQLDPRLIRLGMGIWGVRANVDPETAARLDAERLARWPRRRAS
jgi:hypothetical protein